MTNSVLLISVGVATTTWSSERPNSRITCSVRTSARTGPARASRCSRPSVMSACCRSSRTVLRAGRHPHLQAAVGEPGPQFEQEPPQRGQVEPDLHGRTRSGEGSGRGGPAADGSRSVISPSTALRAAGPAAGQRGQQVGQLGGRAGERVRRGGRRRITRRGRQFRILTPHVQRPVRPDPMDDPHAAPTSASASSTLTAPGAWSRQGPDATSRESGPITARPKHGRNMRIRLICKR